MNETGFQEFMRKKRKSDTAINSSIEAVKEFNSYLSKTISIDALSVKDFELIIRDNIDQKRVAKFLWSLSHYLLFMGRNDLLKSTIIIRERAIKKMQKSFKLREFIGIASDHIKRLESLGIKDAQTLLERGSTPLKRKELAEQASIDIKVIEELARLSDLSRLPGVKGVRSRLYYDAGFDSCKIISMSTQEEILEITRKFVKETGFEGIAPLPSEVASTISSAKKLPALLEW